MKNSLFTIIIISALLASCSPDIVLQQNKDIDSSGWHKDSIIQTEFKPKTDQIYNLYFLIRNNNDYPYSNLFLIAKITDAKHQEIDTLEYEMADAEGKWLGNGIWDLKESKLVFKNNYQFKDSLTKTISLQQADRKSGQILGDSILKGINTVGIIIEQNRQ